MVFIAAKVADSGGTNPDRGRRGDVVLLKPMTAAVSLWDQKLAAGAITQAEYDAQELPGGGMRWPFTTHEESLFFCFVADMTQAQLEHLSRPIENADGLVVGKYRGRVTFSAMTYHSIPDNARKGYDAQTLTNILDRSVRVPTRFDKPAREQEIERKLDPVE